MLYADYAFYSTTFGGTKITADKWNYHAGLASDYIDSVTFGRAASVTDTSTLTLIKKACCLCAEIFYSDYSASETSGNIESEKIGDYSITYKSSESSDVRSAKLISTAKMFLSGTGLLYRGI